MNPIDPIDPPPAPVDPAPAPGQQDSVGKGVLWALGWQLGAIVLSAPLRVIRDSHRVGGRVPSLNEIFVARVGIPTATADSSLLRSSE